MRIIIGLIIAISGMMVLLAWILLPKSGNDTLVSPDNLITITSAVKTPTPTPIPELNPEKILQNISTEEPIIRENEWVLMVTGDVNPGRSVNTQLNSQNSFGYMFEKLADILNSADVVLINLEGALMEGCALTDTGMRFCGDPRQIEGLRMAVVDVASLANNHAMDFGKTGYDETKHHLLSTGIKPLDQMGISVVEAQGISIGFIGVDTVIHRFDQSGFEALMQDTKDQADVLIPYFHWGAEYTSLPSQFQQDLAHQSIELGADLVLGNHSHWVSGIELYQGVPIVYSHGNFVFDQMWSEETREGVIGWYKFLGSELIDAGFIPIYISSSYRPELADEAVTQRIRQRITEASIKIKSTE